MPKPHFTITKKTLQVLHGDSHRERVLHRLHAVALVLGGLSAVQTGRLFGDSSRAVAYWVNRFRERGIIGLEEEARPGRPSSLNAAQMKKVQRFMGKSQIKSKPVGAKTLSDYLSKEFEIVLTPRQCWRIIKRLES